MCPTIEANPTRTRAVPAPGNAQLFSARDKRKRHPLAVAKVRIAALG